MNNNRATLSSITDAWGDTYDLDETHRSKIKGWCDFLITPDRQYQRVFKMHQRLRLHSYLNFIWMCMCAGLTIYFGTFLYVTEADTKCVAAKIFNHTNDQNDKAQGNWSDAFVRFGTVEEAIRSH